MLLKMRHKSVIAFAAFVLALSAIAGGTGVICVGDDGRIALEAVCLPCCDEGEKVCALTNSDDDGHEHADCVDCSDLPLDGPRWSQQNKSGYYQLAQVVFLNPADLAQVVPSAISDEPAQTGRGPTPALVSATMLLSSTILIC
jgi:hypothetical protein